MSHALDSDVTQVSGEALTLEQFTSVWDAMEPLLSPEPYVVPIRVSQQWVMPRWYRCHSRPVVSWLCDMLWSLRMRCHWKCWPTFAEWSNRHTMFWYPREMRPALGNESSPVRSPTLREALQPWTLWPYLDPQP